MSQLLAITVCRLTKSDQKLSDVQTKIDAIIFKSEHKKKNSYHE